MDIDMFKKLFAKYKCLRLNKMSPDEIAKFLETKNVRGVRCSPTLCPLHNYLFGNNKNYTIDGDCTYIILRKTSIFDIPIMFKAPNVSMFIIRFDEGLYPNLLKYAQ